VISIKGSSSPQYLAITDVRGKILRNVEITKNQQIIIDRKDFSPGMYFISLLNANHELIARSKLVVQ
jgi:hypothetical protein